MARPKSGNAPLSPAERQRRYRARQADRTAAEIEARARARVEAMAADSLDLLAMPARRAAEAFWQRRGRKDALAFRTRLDQLAGAEDRERQQRKQEEQARKRERREQEERAQERAQAARRPTAVQIVAAWFRLPDRRWLPWRAAL